MPRLLGPLLSVLLLLPVLALDLTLAGPAASAEPRPVRVASVNAHEGSFVRRGTDIADATDRRALVRRLAQRPGPLPDVLLLQEVLGSTGRVLEELNAHPKVRSAGATYVTATRTSKTWGRGTCDGPRPGRFRLLKSSAILVNTATVTVQQTGVVRTWGRWNRRTWAQTGRRGYACAVHPWVRATVAESGASPTTVRALSVHLAPVGGDLKTEAVRAVRRAVDADEQVAPSRLVVVGGDFNLSRCRGQGLFAPERAGCEVRGGHRALLRAGYRDVVREVAVRGPRGVVGVARRIDFVYARGEVASAWYDRCQQAWLVKRWPCGKKAAFPSRAAFLACQFRAQRFGKPGRRCPAATYRRYYSDHPLHVAALR